VGLAGEVWQLLVSFLMYGMLYRPTWENRRLLRHHTITKELSHTHQATAHGWHGRQFNTRSRFTLLAARGKDLPVHGDGGSVRSYLYVEDVAEAFDAVLHKGVTGRSVWLVPSLWHLSQRFNQSLARCFQCSACGGRPPDCP
jgi:nucleoside-diphosphate-sugar epimerase